MTTADAGDNLLAILAEIEDLITSARGMPMSSSVIIGRQEALSLVDRARQAVPRAVREAEDIVTYADEVLAQGQQEADQIIAHAQEEAERLVASENVVRLATQRADAIVADAEARAEDLRRGADDYSDRCLAALEIEIGRLTDQVRAGREVLASRLQAHGDEGRAGAGWSVDPSAQH